VILYKLLYYRDVEYIAEWARRLGVVDLWEAAQYRDRDGG
jgi:hypothetical protein